MNFLTVQGHRIEVVRLASAHPSPGQPSIVFLHEGLGSVALWRDFPQRVADATGCEAVVYSRYGYGRSDSITRPHEVDFMHDEALKALPELLDKLDIRKPLLLGHSDGASISLIYAGGTGRSLTGAVVMAPHVIVEDICIRSIQKAKEVYDNQETRLRERLARFHTDVDSAFRGWNDVWLHPKFPFWNIEAYLSGITCPILAIQGENDEYGTMDQLDRITRLIPHAKQLRLPACGHSPHRDQPDAVVQAIADFVRSLTGAR